MTDSTRGSVTCKTPGCGKRLANYLLGYAEFTCRHCKQTHEYSHDIPYANGSLLHVTKDSAVVAAPTNSLGLSYFNARKTG
jgi:hypothetical protein